MRKSLFVTGGAGLLAVNWAVTMRNRSQVTLGLHERSVSVAGVASRHTTLESVEEFSRALQEIRPWLVVHTAGMTNVDACEAQPDAARHINVELATNVARVCARENVRLVHISTDHLFSDAAQSLGESHPVSPTNVYGRTKAEAELRVLQELPSALVVRTNFYGWGPRYRRSFSDQIIDALRERRSITLFGDVYYSPILIEVLACAVHDLVEHGATGIFHVSSDDHLSKFQFGIKIAEQFGLDQSLVKRGSLEDHPGLVRRPHSMSLSNQKATTLLGRRIGGIDDHLAMLERQERDGLAREIQGL